MIVVTGPSRSGTSFICSLLKKLGVDLGDEEQLLKGDKWNPEGYFENIECLGLNIRLISGIAIDPNLLRADQMCGIRDRIALGLVRLNYLLPSSLLRIPSRGVSYAGAIRNLSLKYSKNTVKDPRFCLTLGEWRTHGGVEKAVFCIRHPHEVAMSLARQYRLPVFLGYRFWMSYTHEFSRHSEGLDVLWADFNRFFTQGDAPIREMRRLCAFLDKSVAENEMVSILGELKKPSLKHHSAVSSPTRLPRRVRELYDLILLTQRREDPNQSF